MTPVSILIVNYNGGQHLAACLRALKFQTYPRHRFEVIVLDNHSQDGSIEHASQDHPWVRWIRCSKNHGFAEGNNIAAQAAHGKTLILLNNDTIPDPHWLEELMRVVERSPGCTVASKLVFAHRPTIVNSAGLYLLRDGRGADFGFQERDRGQFETHHAIFTGCGAAVALSRDQLGRVLNPDHFLYYEDVDAGWRKQLLGIPSIFAPRSLVRHVHGAAGGANSPFILFYVERNRALTSLTNGDYFLALWCVFVLMAKIPQSFLRSIRGQQQWANTRAVLGAFGSYLVNLPFSFVLRYQTRHELQQEWA